MLGAIIAPAAAHAGGSDGPTPYSVTVDGIALPDGDTFRDNGHVNIRTADGSAGLHFEGKCLERSDAECAGARHAAAQFIGTSLIPWSAFGLSGEFCVTWVQISHYNEHFGEGGQAPVCVGEKSGTPLPEPLPDPELRWVAGEPVVDCDTGTVTTTSREESRSFVRGDDGAVREGAWAPTGGTRSEVRETAAEVGRPGAPPAPPAPADPRTPDEEISPVSEDPEGSGEGRETPAHGATVESGVTGVGTTATGHRDGLAATGSDGALGRWVLLGGAIAAGSGLLLLARGGLRQPVRSRPS